MVEIGRADRRCQHCDLGCHRHKLVEGSRTLVMGGGSDECVETDVYLYVCRRDRGSRFPHADIHESGRGIWIEGGRRYDIHRESAGSLLYGTCRADDQCAKERM